MIILYCHLGLANRLFYFAHGIALGEATGHTVVSLTLPEAGDYFGGCHGAFCVWPRESAMALPWPKWLCRLVEAATRRYLDACLTYKLPGPRIVQSGVDTAMDISLRNPEFIAMLRSHRVVVLRGWLAIEQMELPNPDVVRSFFRPPPALAGQCRKIAGGAKGEADVLIGVHCRWGDYSWYGGGCFYFPLESYARVMRHCVTLFPGKRVAFLVVSNEPEKLKATHLAFPDLRVTFGPQSIIGDLLCLAECDYIVCPASSYSLWAGFLAAKPLWCMDDPHRLPALPDFVVPDKTFAGFHPEGGHRAVAATGAVSGP